MAMRSGKPCSNEKRRNYLASLIYNAFVCLWWLDHGFISGLWRLCWGISCFIFSKAVVETIIHGHKVICNYGYTYPLYSRKFESLNNPLIELVYQTYQIKRKPIILIDVGAAIGDTILLITSNCQGMIKEFYCIDGDPEFFVYLQSNLQSFKEGQLFFANLSDQEGVERELIRTHLGTASAQGERNVRSVTLDSIIFSQPPAEIDLLKIDLDGLDGKVLLGSQRTLERYRPGVIFEWHPILYQKTGNSWVTPFELLEQWGYPQFIWFDKLGNFDFIMKNLDKEIIQKKAQFCLTNAESYPDWHYDIVALHRTSKIPVELLAELNFARRKSCSF